MSYQALYRLWRPQNFTDVVDQEHITKTLQNALLQQNYAHAYLFTGPRGTGKTSTAKILAKAVNCEQAPISEPCNECQTCIGITKGTVVDVIEIDAASNNGVDEIREIRDKVRFAPTEARVKVYIIDEVHMLSQGAFNALLKTLEEPPAHVLFILATTEPHKIPLTIISRCQRFDFHRISKPAIKKHLSWVCEQENVDIDDEALSLLAQVAEGGMRDAFSLLDQAVSYAVDSVTLEDVLAVTGAISQEALTQLANAMMHGDIRQAIQNLDQLMEQGKDPLRLVEDLVYYFRDLLLYQTEPQLEEVLERVHVTDDIKQKAEQYKSTQLMRAIEKLSEAQQEMKWTHHPRVYVEMVCIQLAEPSEQQGEIANGRSLAVSYSEKRDDSEAPLDHSVIQRLQTHIQRLEDKIEQMEERLAQGTTSINQANGEKQTTNQKKTVIKLSKQKLIDMLKSASKQQLVRLSEQWNSILTQVKKKKIVLKALLDDCEPVACGDQFFVLAFQNDFHRNTTENPENRKTIEEVVGSHIQSHVKMVTIMYNEWDEIKQAFIQEQRGDKPASSELEEKDPYQEAVKLVGEEIVELVDRQEKSD